MDALGASREGGGERGGEGVIGADEVPVGGGGRGGGSEWGLDPACDVGGDVGGWQG